MVMITSAFLFLLRQSSLMIKVELRCCSVLFILLLLFGQLYSQNIEVVYKILNKKNEPVPFASFKAAKTTDTLVFQQKNSDSAGIARVRLEKNVQYIVNVTSVK